MWSIGINSCHEPLPLYAGSKYDQGSVMARLNLDCICLHGLILYLFDSVVYIIPLEIIDSAVSCLRRADRIFS